MGIYTRDKFYMTCLRRDFEFNIKNYKILKIIYVLLNKKNTKYFHIEFLI